MMIFFMDYVRLMTKKPPREGMGIVASCYMEKQAEWEIRRDSNQYKMVGCHHAIRKLLLLLLVPFAIRIV